MTREVSSCSIGVKHLLGKLEHFNRVEPAPVFPVKPVRTAICRRDNVKSRLARVAPRLANAFNPRPVQRENQAAAPPSGAGSGGTTA